MLPDLLAIFQIGQKVFFNLPDRAALIHPGPAFKVQIKTAEIQIAGSHGGYRVIRDESLRMDEAFAVLINAHTGFDQLTVIGAGGHVHQLFVPAVGRDNPHVHPAFRRLGQRGNQKIIDNQIWRINIHIFLGVIDDLQIDLLTDIFRVGGAVAIGLGQAVVGIGTGLIPPGVIPGVVLLIPVAGVPQPQKHQGEAPGRFPLQHDGGVLPMSVFNNGVDVLVGQIDAAGKRHLTVDHGDLAVIPVVLQHGQNRPEGIKHRAENAPGRLALIGNANFNGHIIEVRSADGLIDENTPIYVERMVEGTVIVRKFNQ